MPGKIATPLAKTVDKRLYLKGMDRRQMARELGISYQYLSNMLSGRTIPTIGMSVKIAELIQISDDEVRRLALGGQRAAG